MGRDNQFEKTVLLQSIPIPPRCQHYWVWRGIVLAVMVLVLAFSYHLFAAFRQVQPNAPARVADDAKEAPGLSAHHHSRVDGISPQLLSVETDTRHKKRSRPLDSSKGSANTKPTWTGQVQISNQWLAASEEEVNLARQLIAGMTAVIGAKELLTSLQIDDMISSLGELEDWGNAAVPAIKEFLETKEDFDFSQSEGRQRLDYPTLRLNLIAILNQIGGTQAVDTMAQTLSLSSAPTEIGLLAKALETHAPGVYRMEIINTARDTLQQIQAGQQRGAGDVAPLFAVIQDYGDAGVVRDLGQAYPRWKSYTAAALANLSEGAGIPALIDLVDHPAAGAVAHDRFTVLMLAQASRQYPEAGRLLVEMAHSGRLSRSDLVHIGTLLAGKEYVLKTAAVNQGSTNAGQTAGKKPLYIESNRKAANKWSIKDIEQRLNLIDQLLDTDPEPYVASALEMSRNQLSMRLNSQGL